MRWRRSSRAALTARTYGLATLLTGRFGTTFERLRRLRLRHRLLSRSVTLRRDPSYTAVDQFQFLVEHPLAGYALLAQPKLRLKFSPLSYRPLQNFLRRVCCLNCCLNSNFYLPDLIPINCSNPKTFLFGILRHSLYF